MTCPSCGTSSPEGARFCPSCGQALVARPDERRVATVVFADLVGFTTYSETADPEQVKNLVDTCFERLAADVVAFGGQVDKIMGDAIIALFGAPIAHEDDAERAVRASLHMQQTLAALREQHGFGVEMRVGVNTGEVLVGASRAGGDYTAMGDVMNTASRLQTAAQPGQVLVGPSTHAATADMIRYDSLGAISVKGREAPVDVWVALEIVGRPGRRLRARTQLVGRDAELALLSQTISTASTRRRSHYALVLGEAGVGKSRLVIAAAAKARRDHATTVLGGQCAPYGEANIWGPLGEALRHACGIDTSDSSDVARGRVIDRVADVLNRGPHDHEVSRVASGLLLLVGHVEVTQHVDPTRARDDALRSLLAFFEALARRGPVLLVIADLQWADDVVLDAIDRLLTKLRGLPFIVVATARPDPDASRALGAGHYELTRVHLDPLDFDSTAALASALLGEPVDATMAAILQERSGGNPLFVEELVALLRESTLDGAANPADEADRLRRLPVTLRGLVAARLDALPAAERCALENASVVGPRGPVDAVAVLAGSATQDSTIDELQLLADRDLIELDDGAFRFKSEVIRDVAYGILTKAERARRHAVLATWLGQRVTACELDDDIEHLAHHMATAAEIAMELGALEAVPSDVTHRAVAALERAADRAEHIESWRSSHRHYDRALALHTLEDATRWRLLLGRARAHANRHELLSARADADVVLHAATSAGDRRARASALLRVGDIEQRAGELDASSATYEEAVAEWRALGDRGGIAASLRGWGMTRIFRGELDAAEALTSEALATFRELHDRRGEAWALQNLSWISFMRGDTDTADRRLHESAATFAQIGDWGGLNWANGLLGWIRLQQGRLDEAEALGRNALAEASDSGSLWSEGMMTVLVAVASLWTGRIEEAISMGRAARQLFGEIDDHWGGFQACFPLMRGLLARGSIEEAFALLPDIHRLAEHDSNANMRALPDINAASMATQIGDAEAALHHVALALDHGETSTTLADRNTPTGLALLQSGRVDAALATLELARARTTHDAGLSALSGPLALAYAAAGRTAEARDVVELARGLPTGTYLDRIQVAWASGLLLARLGDASAATELEDAVTTVDATQSRVDQAITRLALAHGLEALGSPDAATARLEAHDRLLALGLEARGWETAFAVTAGTAS